MDIRPLSIFAAAVLFAITSAAAVAQTAQSQQSTSAQTPKAAKTKAASKCKGLDEVGCQADTSCKWVMPKKAKAGYCRKAPASKKKAAPAATAPKY